MSADPKTNRNSTIEDFEARQIERLQETCKHFSGLPLIPRNPPTCRAGVNYDTVKDASARPYRWACTDPGCAVTCGKRELYTLEEATAKRQRARGSVKEYLAKIAANVCPICQADVKRQKQVGPCVYAEPCGHRLFQGKAQAVTT